MVIFRIFGRVVDREIGQGIPHLPMEGWDKDLICNDLISCCTTDEQGTFRMEFDETYFRELFYDRHLDLF